MGLLGDAVSEQFAYLLSWLIGKIMDLIIEPFIGVSTLQDLVFGQGHNADYVWGVFPDKVFEFALEHIFSICFSVALVVMAALIVLFGVRTAMHSGTPQGRNEFITTGLLIFFVGLVLVSLPALYDILFNLNQSIIKVFASAYDDAVDDIRDYNAWRILSFEVGSEVGQVLVKLVLVGLAVWANFYYMMRFITLTILLGLGPIFVALYLHPKLKALTSNWIKETISTIFVQSIHALVYWILAIVSYTQSSIIGSVMAMIVFIPVTIAVRGLFGLNGQMQDNIHRAGAAFGMSSLFAMGGAVKGALNGKSFGEVASSAITGISDHIKKNNGTLPMNDAKDTVTGKEASDMAATKNAERMLRNGEILKSLGKGTFGMAGAIAGAGLGTPGALTGMFLGQAAGGVVGGMAGRSGSAAFQALRNSLNPQDGLGDAATLGEDIEKTADALAEQDALTWSQENRDAKMQDLKSRFPDANAKELENLMEQETLARKAELKSKYMDELANAVEYGENHFSGNEQTPKQVAANLASQWGKANEESFKEQYRSANPQMANESDEQYAKRVDDAFQQEMQAVEAKVLPIAARAMKNATNGVGDVSKSKFAQNLTDGLTEYAKETKDDLFDDYSRATHGATKDIATKSALTPEGRLANTNMGHLMAQQASMQAKNAFIQTQIAQGATAEEAENNWNQNHSQAVQSANQRCRASGFTTTIIRRKNERFKQSRVYRFKRGRLARHG